MAAAKKGTADGLGVPAFPAPASQQRITAGVGSGSRNKVALQPGRSLMDWIRLGHSGKDLTGVGGRKIEVTIEEVAKHNTQEDCWMVLKGKVYNVSAYMEYHPGGVEELMRGAGIDGTQLFEEVHKWVNAESMLEKCLIGKVKVETHRRASAASLKSSGSANFLTPNGFATPTISARLQVPDAKPVPKYDWIQSDSTVTVVIYTKWKDFIHENVIIDKEGALIHFKLFIQDYIYLFNIELEEEVTNKYQVKLARPNGKVEIKLEKVKTGQGWKGLGKPLENHNVLIKTSDKESMYRHCKILSVEEVTHDTNLYCLGIPEGTRMCVPTGYHVYVRADINGMEVVRSYTVVPPSLYVDKADSHVEEGSVFYLMIKIYPDGALTPHIGQLKQGDTLEVSDFDGNFVKSRLEECSHLVMCAAGTGFTPMARLLGHATLCKDKYRSIKLMFFNKKEKSTDWRDQLQKICAENENISVTHVLSQSNAEWTGLTGRIRIELLEEFIPLNEEDSKLLFCACGPTPFTNEAVRLVEELGVSKDSIHAFLA